MQNFTGHEQVAVWDQPDTTQSVLKHALAHHVIPMLVERNAAYAEPRSAPRTIKPDLGTIPCDDSNTRPTAQRDSTRNKTITPLVSALLADDQVAADGIVARLLDQSRCRSSILTEVFAPAAVRLGEMWSQDTATFSDVTLGVAMLCRMMRNMCEEVLALQPTQHNKNALIVSSARDHHQLLSCTGDQHQFGTQMVCQLLRLQGWQVRHIAIGDMKEAENAVARMPFCFVGLSLGLEDNCNLWKQRLKRLRTQSCNQRMKIIVGGLGVSCVSDADLQLDADKSFDNAMSALPYVENLYEKQQIMPAFP